jgi:hypothetical protein
MRTPDRLIDVMLSINDSSWVQRNMRLAAGMIATGVASPAMIHQVTKNLDAIRAASTSEHVKEIASEAAFYVAKLGTAD